MRVRAGRPAGAAFVCVIGLALLLSACSSRPDSADIETVQNEIERARQADAEIWAADELRAAEEALNTALAAIAADGGWFKSYDQARQFLARARDEAAAAAEAAIAGKAQARADAEATIAAAEDVLEEARSRLETAPSTRASRADRSMFRNDLDALPGRLEGARQSLDGGEIEKALEEATAVESAAAALLDRIEGSLQRRALPPK
jgi:hypothetical protein